MPTERTSPRGGCWRRGFILIAVAVGMAGCASGKAAIVAPAADLLGRGERQLERGRFREAEATFRVLLEHYPGDSTAPRAQLGLARSILGEKEFDRARGELTALTERYPDASEVEEARYYIGVAYSRESLPAEMDQTITHKALEEFEAYLADFPSGRHRKEALSERNSIREKLAEKDVRNGFLYLRMGFPDAARELFQGVIDRYGDTARVDRAGYGLAEALRAEGRQDEAGAIYRRLMESSADPDVKKDSERRLRETG